MQLKKSTATLDELLQQEEEIKSSIKTQQRQLKTVAATRKQFQKLTAAIPPERSHRRAKRASKTEAAA